MVAEYTAAGTRLLPLPTFIRNIERYSFDLTDVDKQFQEYWHYSVYAAVAYLILIYVFKKFMENRKPFELRGPLIAWNGFLAVFSILGAYRAVPAFIQLAQKSTLRETMCFTGWYDANPEGFWSVLFVLSKVPELVDTFFIIARKRPLIFLHWYHHTTVMMYSFYLYRDRLAGGTYYGTMNYTVHAIMYTYYCLRACKIRVPRFIAMIVTFLQLSQMFVGVWVTLYLWGELGNEDCKIHGYNLLAASAMYSTYLYLFAEFFVKAYITGGSKKGDTKKTK